MSSPFRMPATGASFFGEAAGGRAELKLAYAIEQAVDVSLLVGGPGLGKTTLLRRLTDGASAGNVVVVDLFFPQLELDDLLASIDEELADGHAGLSGDRAARLGRIAQRVRTLGSEGHGVLLTIDDAHLLRGPAIFEALHQLLNLQEREAARLTVILAGDRRLLSNLAKVPAFAQRIGVSATLAPLNGEETASYIRHRLRSAGRDETLFGDDALAAVFERSAGVMRTVNRLCELALVVAEADGSRRVSAHDVAAASDELPAFVADAT